MFKYLDEDGLSLEEFINHVRTMRRYGLVDQYQVSYIPSAYCCSVKGTRMIIFISEKLIN